MIVGVIFCAYESEDFLTMSLSPWIAAKREGLGGHTFKICAVACPFTGFPHDPAKPLDGTIPRLQQHLLSGDIDCLITSSHPMPETEARGRALRRLMNESVEFIWQADADEKIEQQDILNITRFVEQNPWMQWFRVCYRNLVFDDRHWLAEPFAPPRLHRTYAMGGYITDGFGDDNNVSYSRYDDGARIQDVAYSSITVPPAIANPLHYSWLNNERSRRKVEYQLSRGWLPSFKWNYIKNCLEWNEKYYAKYGLPCPPELHENLTILSGDV